MPGGLGTPYSHVTSPHWGYRDRCPCGGVLVQLRCATVVAAACIREPPPSPPSRGCRIMAVATRARVGVSSQALPRYGRFLLKEHGCAFVKHPTNPLPTQILSFRAPVSAQLDCGPESICRLHQLAEGLAYGACPDKSFWIVLLSIANFPSNESGCA